MGEQVAARRANARPSPRSSGPSTLGKTDLQETQPESWTYSTLQLARYYAEGNPALTARFEQAQPSAVRYRCFSSPQVAVRDALIDGYSEPHRTDQLSSSLQEPRREVPCESIEQVQSDAALLRGMGESTWPNAIYVAAEQVGDWQVWRNNLGLLLGQSVSLRLYVREEI